MRIRSFLIFSVKLSVLLAIAAGLYAFSRSHEKELPIIDDDDVNVTAQVTVQTGKVEQRMFQQYADVYGTVEAEPAREGRPAADAIIMMPISAVVAEVDCLEGSYVRQGQTLFTLDGRAAKAAVERAAAVQDAAQRANVTARADSQMSVGDKLRFEREAADAAADFAQARAMLDRLAIASPISGTVLRLNVRPGEVALARAKVIEIADENRLVIACSAPAWILPLVVPGASAEAVFVDRDGDESVTSGKVSFVDPGLDPATGAASIDVSLQSSATTQFTGHLHIGQIVHVRLVTAEHRALGVPEPAIVEDAQGHATISRVERDFRWAVRQTVDTGLRDGGWVEVRSAGLAAGQDVVTVGAFALTDNCRIAVTR